MLRSPELMIIKQDRIENLPLHTLLLLLQLSLDHGVAPILVWNRPHIISVFGEGTLELDDSAALTD